MDDNNKGMPSIHQHIRIPVSIYQTIVQRKI